MSSTFTSDTCKTLRMIKEFAYEHLQVILCCLSQLPEVKTDPARFSMCTVDKIAGIHEFITKLIGCKRTATFWVKHGNTVRRPLNYKEDQRANANRWFERDPTCRSPNKTRHWKTSHENRKQFKDHVNSHTPKQTCTIRQMKYEVLYQTCSYLVAILWQGMLHSQCTV